MASRRKITFENSACIPAVNTQLSMVSNGCLILREATNRHFFKFCSCGNRARENTIRILWESRVSISFHFLRIVLRRLNKKHELSALRYTTPISLTAFCVSPHFFTAMVTTNHPRRHEEQPCVCFLHSYPSFPRYWRRSHCHPKLSLIASSSMTLQQDMTLPTDRTLCYGEFSISVFVPFLGT